MNEDSSEARPPYVWEIQHLGQSFKMISRDPVEVALAWLATMEDDGPLPRLPTEIMLDNWSVPIISPWSGVVMATWVICRLRDLQRQAQGLPPYWAPLADRHELILAGVRPREAWDGDDRDVASEPPIDPPGWMLPWEEGEP